VKRLKLLAPALVLLLLVGAGVYGWYYFYYDEDGNERIPSPLIETKKDPVLVTPESLIEPGPAPIAPRRYRSRDNDDDDEDDDDEDDNSCHISDGTHSATVEYTNPDTGYETTYTLDVVVTRCEVIEIDFPKGGWLDGHHIDPTELDDDGNASIEDDRGRTFDVHIDN